jgi:hypothetical protein
MLNSILQDSYDQLPYNAKVIPQAHPGRLVPGTGCRFRLRRTWI